MANDFFDITWGNVRLWCSEVSTDNSRTQVIHELATGDDHPVQDRGAKPRITRCTVEFLDMPGETKKPRDRFLEFKAQVDSGEEYAFTHPIDGAYFAKVGECTILIDEDSNITVTVEFIPNAVIAATLQPGLGTAPGAGYDAVAATAADLLADLEDSDIVSTIPTDATDAITRWQDEETSTRDVLNDVGNLSNGLSSLIENEGLEDDIALFDAYRSTIMLGDAIRSAAIAATSETPSIFFLKVSTPASPLALAARIAGGALAEEYERQIRALNDIRTVAGLIESGTELAMPALKRAA